LLVLFFPLKWGKCGRERERGDVEGETAEEWMPLETPQTCHHQYLTESYKNNKKKHVAGYIYLEPL